MRALPPIGRLERYVVIQQLISHPKGSVVPMNALQAKIIKRDTRFHRVFSLKELNTALWVTTITRIVIAHEAIVSPAAIREIIISPRRWDGKLIFLEPPPPSPAARTTPKLAHSTR
jgi:hypothetical protein